ncbi:MAG: hypothetical protein WA755_00275 [Candidatus Acidiferrales bacterium]
MIGDLGLAIRTTGEVFSDGTSIELIRAADSGRHLLMLCAADSQMVAPRVDAHAQTYVPADLEPWLSRAITLPSSYNDYGRTSDLFAEVRELFKAHGFGDEVSLPAAYFVFASWFPECSEVAPGISITGPWFEATVLLHLLECITRHPLRLGEFTRSGICTLPLELQLTLLVDQRELNASARSFLTASAHRGAYIHWHGTLIDVFRARALYRGNSLGAGDFDDLTLRVHLAPSRGRLSILDAIAKRAIADEFQGKMLAYRCRNISTVRESRFELSGFASGTRILSRVFGSCIVDAPEIQAGLEGLLQVQEDHDRVGRWTDLRCVAVEALLYHCHVEQKEKIYVGKATSTASAILSGRGETTLLSPEKFGRVLRFLGLAPQRDNKGFGISLTDRVRRRIHELARDYDVAAVQEATARCPLCSEILSAAGPGDQNGFGSGNDDAESKQRT